MSELSVHIYSEISQLPTALMRENIFHSPQLFELAKKTPRHRPYMLTLEDGEGTVVAQLLGLVRYRSSWLPPYFYMHCHIYGEGSYSAAIDSSQHAKLFSMMLGELTRHLGRGVLYIEVSNLTQKMFGYKEMRQLGYFPVRWMSIHNSLHSRTPEERLQPRMKQRIDDAYSKGVVTDEVSCEEEFKAFSKLLRHHNWLKPKRFLPADEFFRGIKSQYGRLFVTKYRNHVIGCSMVTYSQQQAYLWYSAFRRKSFAFVHPAEVTIWHAIRDSYERGSKHIFFLDVGLPYRTNHFRDFILRFGGKPTSTYRWFRCSIGWLNSLLSWFYKD